MSVVVRVDGAQAAKVTTGGMRDGLPRVAALEPATTITFFGCQERVNTASPMPHLPQDSNIGLPLSRRRFLSWTAMAAAISTRPLPAAFGASPATPPSATLPFENGRRPLVAYPQKRPLLRLTSRPPQLETPFEVFDEGTVTPNDAFFVRYHLAGSPPSIDRLGDGFRLQIKGAVENPLALTVERLRQEFDLVEFTAVNQCSGNSRGFFEPRVPGGQLGNGAMGNARWKGVLLRDVLKRAAISPKARQITLDGLDQPVLPKTPDYVKALDLDFALGHDCLLAFEMNGEPLPWLNGFPLRLVVPGYYGTYWLKHLHEIQVIEEPFSGFWMNPAYRIPDTEGACVEPGTTPKQTIPIHRMNVRSFITNLAPGAQVARGRLQKVRGIAFDGGEGIHEVLFSPDDGATWQRAELGPDQGRYGFRGWTASFTPNQVGQYRLRVKATNRIGASQPMQALWNPAGYMRNVVESLPIQVA